MPRKKLNEINIVLLSSRAKLPTYGSDGAACFDFYSPVRIVLKPEVTTAVPLGLCMEVPDGYELQLRSRSGLSRIGIVVANAPATIDSDYRGEIKVLLFNRMKTPYEVDFNNRICQGCIMPVERVKFKEEKVLSRTIRGSDGFGSTGL